jgi:hypothetical protein
VSAMPFTAATNPSPTPRRRKAKPRRSRITADPMRARHDGNTSRGMRARDIYRGLLERVGGEADVLAAAELKVACEDLRGKMLAGEAVDSNHLVRIRRLKKIASGTGALPLLDAANAAFTLPRISPGTPAQVPV